MTNLSFHTINSESTAREALRKLSCLPDNSSLTLFIINELGSLIGTVTDGDIRRGLLKELNVSDSIIHFMNDSFKYVKDGDIDTNEINKYKALGIMLLPVLDNENKIIRILDLKKTRVVLPLTAMLMAGGRGERLKPLTDQVPKPMLMVGNKPIIEHNIDRLISYGINELYISVRYLSDQIKQYFGDGSSKGVTINYIDEDEPLGTLGAISKLKKIKNNDILVMNSDILTNIDYEDFYKVYLEYGSEMTLVSIPYNVAVPYAVLNTNLHIVNAFEEKPNFTYYSNGGIYLINSKFISMVPENTFFNATDLMELIIKSNFNLTHYPLLSYWLDIGRHQDYLKAQDDIKHITI